LNQELAAGNVAVDDEIALCARRQELAGIELVQAFAQRIGGELDVGQHHPAHHLGAARPLQRRCMQRSGQLSALAVQIVVVARHYRTPFTLELTHCSRFVPICQGPH